MPDQQRPPDAHYFGGIRIDWTPKDVLIGIGGFLALFLLVPLPVTLPFAVGYGTDSDEFYASALVVSAVSQASIVAVAALLTFRKYGGGWDRLGVRTPTWGTLGWALAAFLGALALSAAYSLLVNALDIEWLMSECDDQIPSQVLDNNTLFILAGVAVIGFAPICEELFFRGFVAPGISRGWGAAAGIIGSAALFSVAHVSGSLHKTLVPIFAIGLVFAYVYFRSGNIISTMLAHLAFNVIAFTALAQCEPE